jgi:hypothetical protein
VSAVTPTLTNTPAAAELRAGASTRASAAAEFDDRPGPVRDVISAGVLASMGELARQATVAGVQEPTALAFEIYSLGLGANACSRLLADGGAFGRARAAIERRLDSPRF